MAFRRSLNSTSGRHAWSAADRTILGALTKFYETTKEERLRIVNFILHDRLEQEGLTEGLTITQLEAQINDLRRTVRGREEFQYIHSMDLVQARALFHNERDTIEMAAVSIQIELRLRVHPTSTPTSTQTSNTGPALDLVGSSRLPNKHPSGSSKPFPFRATAQASPSRSTARRQRRASTGVEEQVSDFTPEPLDTAASDSSYSDSCSSASYDPGSDSDDLYFRAPHENAFAKTSRRIPRLLRITFNYRGKRAAQRPRLLFRAFEPKLGLRSRAFQDVSKGVPNPPAHGEFKEMVHRHLSEDKEYSSPMISWTENTKRALQIISKDQESRYLAIIDYLALEEDLDTRFGSNVAGPFLVPALCNDLGLDDLYKIHASTDSTAAQRKGYKGDGEFLVYGTVECEVVGILETDKALELFRAMDAFKKDKLQVGLEIGVAVGECLGSVQEIYREVVGRKLLHAWRLGGYDRSEYHFDYLAFVEGLYANEVRGKSRVASPSPLPSTGEDQDWIDVDGDMLRDSGCHSKLPDSVRGAPRVRILIQGTSAAALTSSTGAKAELVPGVDEASQQRLVDSQIAKTAAPFGVVVEREQPRPSFDSTLNLFMAQVRQNALIPSPTPPLQTSSVPVALPALPPVSQTKAKVAVHESAGDARPLPTPARRATNGHTSDHPSFFKTSTAAKLPAPPQQSRLKRSPSDILDLTRDGPSASLLPSSVLSEPRSKLPRTLMDPQPRIRQFYPQTRPKTQSRAPFPRGVNTSADVKPKVEKDLDEKASESDTPVIVAAATYRHRRRSHVRTTTKTETRTVLTIRSRSVSSSVVENLP